MSFYFWRRPENSFVRLLCIFFGRRRQTNVSSSAPNATRSRILGGGRYTIADGGATPHTPKPDTISTFSYDSYGTKKKTTLERNVKQIVFYSLQFYSDYRNDRHDFPSKTAAEVFNVFIGWIT